MTLLASLEWLPLYWAFPKACLASVDGSPLQTHSGVLIWTLLWGRLGGQLLHVLRILQTRCLRWQALLMTHQNKFLPPCSPESPSLQNAYQHTTDCILTLFIVPSSYARKHLGAGIPSTSLYPQQLWSSGRSGVRAQCLLNKRMSLKCQLSILSDFHKHTSIFSE